jgi:hypothetical protein
LFHYLLGIEKIDQDAKIIVREAVRAVIVRDGKKVGLRDRYVVPVSK